MIKDIEFYSKHTKKKKCQEPETHSKSFGLTAKSATANAL